MACNNGSCSTGSACGRSMSKPTESNSGSNKDDYFVITIIGDDCVDLPEGVTDAVGVLSKVLSIINDTPKQQEDTSTTQEEAETNGLQWVIRGPLELIGAPNRHTLTGYNDRAEIDEPAAILQWYNTHQAKRLSKTLTDASIEAYSSISPDPIIGALEAITALLSKPLIDDESVETMCRAKRADDAKSPATGSPGAMDDKATSKFNQAQFCAANGPRHFKGHDFNTVLFNESDENDYLLIGDFLSKRVFRIFGQDQIYLTYAGVPSEDMSVERQTLEFFVALRSKLSYQDLGSGNITINGDIIETLDFMRMMDALRGADEHMRIPPYSDIVKEQFWVDFVVNVYGAETVYGAMPYRHTPGGPIRKLAKLAALPRIIRDLVVHDDYIGCRAKA